MTQPQDLLIRKEIEHYRKATGADKICDMALAYLDTLADSKTPRGWQPIETAPRDGTMIIGLWPDGFSKSGRRIVDLTRYVSDQWEHGYYCTGEGSYRYEAPTHWQPLPSPPTLSAKDNKNEQ